MNERLTALVVTDDEGGVWLTELAKDWLLSLLGKIDCCLKFGWRELSEIMDDAGAERNPVGISVEFIHIDHRLQLSERSVMSPGGIQHVSGYQGSLWSWVKGFHRRYFLRIECEGLPPVELQKKSEIVLWGQELPPLPESYNNRKFRPAKPVCYSRYDNQFQPHWGSSDTFYNIFSGNRATFSESYFKEIR